MAELVWRKKNLAELSHTPKTSVKRSNLGYGRTSLLPQFLP